MLDKDTREVWFTYTNWRGETSERKVLPLSIWFGSTEWHPEEQWFIRGTDVEKGEERDFALTDMVFTPKNGRS